MNQQERTQKTRERIIASALHEFSRNTYDSVSLNRICAKGQIPKGLLYHNYKGKDDLYLTCVKASFDALAEELKKCQTRSGDAKGLLQELLLARAGFLQHQPEYANLFFRTVIQPPNHLTEEIKNLRKELDQIYREVFETVLDSVQLRNGIIRENAIEYFMVASELFNRYFQQKAQQGNHLDDLIQDHEGKLPTLLDMMLYGIVSKKEGVEP